jgi:hypothetical protein
VLESERQHLANAKARLDAADKRDALADRRDRAALAREAAAAARDLAMADSDAASEGSGDARALTRSDDIIRAAGQRKRAARQRERAAEDRALAAQDRQARARDREQAARERRYARADREALADLLAIRETERRRAAHARVAGLADSDHEPERRNPPGAPLIVAYISVLGPTGDLLDRVVTQVRARFRPHDLLVQIDRDEYVRETPADLLARADAHPIDSLPGNLSHRKERAKDPAR